MPAVRGKPRVAKAVKVVKVVKVEDEDDSPTKLKQQLLITPKTVSILLRIGIVDYRDLQHFSTNQLLAQIAKQPDVKPGNVDGYRRAVRRLVWLGTQDQPETIAKNCPDWTNKSLKAKGTWVDGYDDLTGREVDEKFGEILLAAALK